MKWEANRVDKSRWTRDEVALCALAYKRGGWPVASVVLQVCGFPRRSPAAVHTKMQKLGVVIERASP